METIILASESPRRREMLERVGLPFRVIPPRINENSHLAGAVRDTAGELARLKVLAVAGRIEDPSHLWIVSADTIVEIGGRILGKPENQKEACEFLTLLSGKQHLVHTGVALQGPALKIPLIRIRTTVVTFREMTDREMAFYVETGEWSGAAGAYRIQERGGFFVESVQGSYSNVVGLPMETLYMMLVESGYRFQI